MKSKRKPLPAEAGGGGSRVVEAVGGGRGAGGAGGSDGVKWKEADTN